MQMKNAAAPTHQWRSSCIAAKSPVKVIKAGSALADIFVSYKKEDRPTAEKLVAALRRAGKSVWWDDALNPSQAWDAMIEREIAQARHVLVLWTPRSVQSDWVRTEAHYAQDHGKLVPVIAEPCSPPIAFMLRQAVNLSSGRFDESDPNWTKLLGWLEGGAAEHPPAADRAEVRAAAPGKATTEGGWFGPIRSRPVLAYGGAAALALAAVVAGAFLARGLVTPLKPPQPPVVIDPITVADAKGLPDNFAKAISDEMFADFSSSSRISPVEGDGHRRKDAYQLVSDAAVVGDKAQVVAKLYAPRLDAPVLTVRLAYPATNKALPLEFGARLANLTRCIATASDSIGSELTVLPTPAFEPWAKFCQQMVVGPGDPQTMAATLRNVTAAAPDFANGWSNLAETLFESATMPGADKANLIAESQRAADRALALDPKSAKALQVKGWAVLGQAGDPNSPSGLGRMHNFTQWEALALKSIRVRPSDCGCEMPGYAAELMMFGRASAAVPILEQSVNTDPVAIGDGELLAGALGLSGQPALAEKQLSDMAEKWPDSRGIRAYRMVLALWRKDWTAARKYLDGAPDGVEKQTFPAVLDALQRGDMAAARTAAAPFIAVNASRETMSLTAISAMAAAGYVDETADALEFAITNGEMANIIVAYAPVFAAVRKTPKFASLAERMGLMDYWRMPGHRPDFCKEPDAPNFCASLSRI